MTTIKINGEKVVLDPDELDFSGDISQDMEKIAALINTCGEQWAAAEEQLINIDAAYRQWRAEKGNALLHKDPKLAEWKVNQNVESDEQFVTYKQAIARAKHVALLLKNRFNALDKKASAIQSRGAMMRSEMDATNMSTPRTSTVTNKKKAKAKAAMRA